MADITQFLDRSRRFAIKGKQYVMEYDLDFPDRSTLIRQRIYYTPYEDDIDVFTPLTPTIADRLRPTVDIKCVPTRLPFIPRKGIACFDNPNVDRKYSEYQVFIPYRPTDSQNRLKVCLREIMDIPEVAAVEYSGETHTIGVEEYVS